jgi:hypothetical protein
VQDETPPRIETLAGQLRSSSSFTFARSLFHAAEGKELFDSKFVFASAVSTYYSLFHLGGALILAYCSRPSLPGDCHASIRSELEKNWAKRQLRTLSNGKPYLPDPAEAMRHNDVPMFLERELPELSESLGRRDRPGTLRDMREFVSYAPRIVSDGLVNVVYSGCQYKAQEFRDYLEQHLGRIDEFFCDSARWLSRNGYEEVCLRILSGDFILFEFAELRWYQPASIVKRAWAIYRSVCENEGADWRVYRSDPGTWHTDEAQRRERYAEVVHSFHDAADSG